MKRATPIALLTSIVFSCFAVASALSADDGVHRLWTIGLEDNANAEFALAPRGYGEFREDGFFIVGKSDARQDWPYVHPGPDDSWAGGHSHTFGIAFGLATAPKSGECRLLIDLVDTQNAIPPKLQIAINSRTFEQATPRGAGDASVNGQPEKGSEHKLEITFPADTLAVGNNHISITTLSGSWIMYDWIGLDVPAGATLSQAAGTVVRSVETAPLLVQRDGKLMQTVQVSVLHFGQPGQATISVTGSEPLEQQLQPGQLMVDLAVPAVSAPTDVTVTVQAGQKVLADRKLTLLPVRKWVVYLLPHSHVDIGYTHVQTDVEKSHWEFYEQAIEAAQKTADYPPGAQFKWNAEVLWATDSYLKQASPEKKQAFIEAVKNGWIGLDALYGNELTGLCRPEELVQLVDFGNRLKRKYQIPIESAMISDVPGYTWGIVSVLAESGVKYFSIGPNGGHRIGYTLSQYGDKPFWWRSPCGQHRILCWIPRTGYWRGFRGEAGLVSLLRQMEEADYPYDLVQIRHCLGDNAGPGTDMSEFVKDWNTKYAYPKLVIATTREMMAELERRYGDQLPELRGDFTPYWEDGAASSAQETALNRAAAERLVQAETLYSLLQPEHYPDDQFQQAWRNVVLYDEHTWGAHCSISQPESDFTKAQWAIKQQFALDADLQSKKLLEQSVSKHRSQSNVTAAVDVFNTCSWPRTDIVTISRETKVAGELVKDAQGTVVPSQRLKTGELVFLASQVPPLAAKRFTFHAGSPGEASVIGADGAARAEGLALSTGLLRVTLNETTGAIATLEWDHHDYARPAGTGEPQLNDYFYVAGRNPKEPLRNGPVSVVVQDRGPLVASVAIASDAPGCNGLVREIRVVAGLDFVDIVNTVDKKNVYDQEAVHFAFPFQVPDGVIRMDIPWAVAQVETDQMPGSCKNYFTVQRWVDVSNNDRGVTLATIDAPLFEVGRITCDPVAVGWIKELEPTQTIYSYVMNNYWETNYKASQEGPTAFRYSIQPHGKYDSVAAQRFGIARSQPLVAVPVTSDAHTVSSSLHVESDAVIVTSIKPDANALIVRLFNVSDKPSKVTLRGKSAAKSRIELCDLTGQVTGQAPDTIELVPWQIVTLESRADAHSNILSRRCSRHRCYTGQSE